jgi:twitching motility two-component system response regulator PilH
VSQLGRFRKLLGLGRNEERRQRERVDARKGLKVLIIDDSRTVVAALSHMLRQSGYVPFGASDGEKGLELAVSEQPDLIFLDIVLPGLNGFAALRRLRKNPKTADIPVIMISGNPQAAEKFYLERIGADDFMKKPFGRAEVFNRIEKLVRGGGLPARRASVPTEPAPEQRSVEGHEVRIHDHMPEEGFEAHRDELADPETTLSADPASTPPGKSD